MKVGETWIARKETPNTPKFGPVRITGIIEAKRGRVVCFKYINVSYNDCQWSIEVFYKDFRKVYEEEELSFLD